MPTRHGLILERPPLPRRAAVRAHSDVATDPWGCERLNLDVYLGCIGVVARAPSLDALRELHEAHVRTFTFDNIDVLLGRGPVVDLPAIDAKFVGRHRGGYCFEHATLFAAALVRLGYLVERRLGRVGDPRLAPRTHMVVVVNLDGVQFLADPGFGRGLLRPIALSDGAVDDYGGWVHRVREIAPRSWQLSRAVHDGWEILHTHDIVPVAPIDVVVGNHYVSTFPGSRFRSGLMLIAHRPGYNVSVTGHSVTVRYPARPPEFHEITPDYLPEVLASHDLDLSGDLTALLTILSDLEP